jgi:hypothetical protein
MSSDNNGRKPDSQEPGPSSGTTSRLSARAPSAWGATRDALAAVHNLEALLRGASVRYPTILDLLPELHTGAAVLHDAFERARLAEGAGAEAVHDVGVYGLDRAGELVRLLDATAAGQEDREGLAGRAHQLAGELEASADLLALLERAADPVPTDVSVDLVVRETVRVSGSGRGRKLVVRFDEALPDCTLHADPYLVGPLLALLVALVEAEAAGEVVVQARCTDLEATFTVRPATAEDAALATLAMRVLPTVPPSVRVAGRVAEQLGATLHLEARGASLRLRCPPG